MTGSAGYPEPGVGTTGDAGAAAVCMVLFWQIDGAKTSKGLAARLVTKVQAGRHNGAALLCP